MHRIDRIFSFTAAGILQRACAERCCPAYVHGEVMVIGQHVYRNKEITLFWKPEKCRHSGMCVTRFPQIFSPGRMLSAGLHGVSLEAIVAAAAACPSGALSIAYNDVPGAEYGRNPF